MRVPPARRALAPALTVLAAFMALGFTRRAPDVVANDNIKAARAGTFIYHTHLNDMEQLTGGLYGPIVVLEPGKVFDTRVDHLHIVGWDSGKEFQMLVNGDSLASSPIEMHVGETHRFRFINIGMAGAADFTIKRDTVLAAWTPVAKDGAELPAAQRTVQKARLVIDVGQTWDLEFTATEPGTYILGTPTGPKKREWERLILVR